MGKTTVTEKLKEIKNTLQTVYGNHPLICQVVIGIILMLPILIASLYTHPWWDDYIYTTPGYLQFQQDHSFLGAIKNAAAISYDKYVNNSGVFAHHFIAAMFPLFMGYSWYKVGMLLSNLFFIFSVYFLAVTIGDRALKIPRRVSALAGTLILVITSYFMQTPHEFFFWMSGACNYTIIVSFLACGAALIIRACTRKPGAIRWLYVALASLLAFTIGGCNQSTAMLAFMLEVFAMILVFWRSKSRFPAMAVLITSFFGMIGFVLNVFSSGNQDRLAGYEQMAPLAAVWESLTSMLEKVLEWSQGVPLIAGLALVPVFLKLTEKMEFRFSHPFLILFFSFCVMASQYTPPLYAMQELGPGRITDCVYYSYLWWLFGNLFYLCGFYTHRFQRGMETGRIKRLYPAAVALLALVIVSPGAVKESTAVTCVSQFLTGEIQTYDKEMTAIHEALENTEGDTVVVNDLTADPIIRAGSFSSNSNSIINRTAAEYHGKEKLIVKKAAEDD